MSKVAVFVPAKQRAHYTEKYLIDPSHPVTINVIGCGGTGSQVLNSLARMNSALQALGHPGLFVRAIDPDRVTSANMGRQLFSPADIDEFKAAVLIGRINRFFGYDWVAVPDLYRRECSVPFANITISCVDTGKSRQEIKGQLMAGSEGKYPKPVKDEQYYGYRNEMHPYEKPYYWMDFGNTMEAGQVVIGTIMKVAQPKASEFDLRDNLPTVDQLHPDIMIDVKGEDQGPSCSLAEALQKQDLFINTNLANMGLGLLWKMFRNLKISHHGLYMNLNTMVVNPIKIA